MITLSRITVATIVACLMTLSNESVAQQAETMKVPTFGTVTIYRGSATPQQIVFFLSGDGGWNLGVVGMAEQLRDAGALVVGIDVRAFMKSLEASNGCAYPAGALEAASARGAGPAPRPKTWTFTTTISRLATNPSGS